MAPLFDLDGKKKQIAENEEKMAAPDFWNDQKHAQSVIKNNNQLKALLENHTKLTEAFDGLAESVTELGRNYDEELEELVEEEYGEQMKVFEAFEIQVLLSGPYDNHDAILEIHPGAGGTEAMDWASMLYRM